MTILFAAVSGLALLGTVSRVREGAGLIRVALVDRQGGLLSRIAIGMIEEETDIAALMSFDETTEEEAMEGLREGLYAAVIILPEGYVDKIRYGYSGQGTILLSEAAAASADEVEAIAKFGELMLAAGQNGVFAGENLIWKYGIDEAREQDFLNRSNQKLVFSAISITDEGMSTSESAYDGTGMSTEGNYAACWITFLLFVSGIFLSALYTADTEKSMVGRLRASGVSSAEYLLWKILFPCLFRTVLAAAAVTGIGFVLRVSPLGILTALPGILMMSVMITCGAILLSAYSGWQGILLALCAAGLFLSGGILHRHLMPELLIRFGDLLPFGSVQHLVSPLFGGRISLVYLLTGALWSGLLFALALRHLERMPSGGGVS
ncbi:MAG: ABC transporter permease [Lachnospiraceae bacterium]|nr:ABC transporter permease [Lachnospiraceae bacterium]